MPGQLVTIATFDLPVKARLAQNVLEKAGIKAVVTDEMIVTMDWLLGNAVGWVKVQVMEEDAENAVAALEESLGGGDEPVDEEALAAEAEAAGAEEGAEPLQSPQKAPKSLDREDRALAAVGAMAAPPTEEAEPQPSERDEYARRLFLTAVFSVVVPPLWFYAIYLFLNASLGEGPISGRGRSHLLRGSAVMGAGLLFLFAVFLFI